MMSLFTLVIAQSADYIHSIVQFIAQRKSGAALCKII